MVKLKFKITLHGFVRLNLDPKLRHLRTYMIAVRGTASAWMPVLDRYLLPMLTRSSIFGVEGLCLEETRED